MTKAEFILHVLDASEPLTRRMKTISMSSPERNAFSCGNKTDLPTKLEPPTFATKVVDVCCLSGQGIEGLKDAIKELAWSGEIKAEMLQVAISSRHQDALNRARAATRQAAEALRCGLTLELIAFDLRIAANAVGEIVGKTTTEDLLDSIFSTFCIGK